MIQNSWHLTQLQPNKKNLGKVLDSDVGSISEKLLSKSTNSVYKLNLQPKTTNLIYTLNLQITYPLDLVPNLLLFMKL